jgi:hypothetical protein
VAGIVGGAGAFAQEREQRPGTVYRVVAILGR